MKHLLKDKHNIQQDLYFGYLLDDLPLRLGPITLERKGPLRTLLMEVTKRFPIHPL